MNRHFAAEAEHGSLLGVSRHDVTVVEFHGDPVERRRAVCCPRFPYEFTASLLQRQLAMGATDVERETNGAKCDHQRTMRREDL